MEIPDDILEKLTCFFCNEYLSYPPFYYIPKIGSFCGRHRKRVADGRMQSIIEKNYELIANFILFPCRNRKNGCNKKFIAEQIPIHELFCTSKSYLCPIRRCLWQGPDKELTSHFYLFHKPLFLIDNYVDIELVVRKYFKKDFFLVAFDEYFMIRCDYQNFSGTFRCCVHFINNRDTMSQEYNYEISLKSNDGQFFRSHAKCLVQPNFSKCDRNKECELSLSTLNNFMEKPFILILRVKFIKGSDEEEAKAANTEEDGILEILKCPVCLEYMVPPIFQCLLGHSFCFACISKLKKCATCRQRIGYTRNFCLEKVTEKITYHCSFSIDGCNFKSDSSNIKNHEFECKYKMRNCFFAGVENCKYTGPLVNMFQHCINVHPNKIQIGAYYEMKYESSHDYLEVNTLKCNFGLLFKIRYSYSKDKVMCSVQCVNPRKSNSIFMYEMQVINLNSNRMELLSKKVCGDLSQDKNDVKHCTIWHIDMVKPLISRENSNIKFKCTIYEET